MDTAWWPHLKEGEVNLILAQTSASKKKYETFKSLAGRDFGLCGLNCMDQALVLENEISQFADNSN